LGKMLSGFNLVVYFLWGIFWIYWLISALQISVPTRLRENSLIRWVYWILLVAEFGILISNPVTLGPLSWHFIPNYLGIKVMGIIVLFLGLSFSVQARVYLGQFWSGWVSIKVGHKLIQTGPYRIVRHPIYTGLLFGFIGTTMVYGAVGGFDGH
jgi:hypothetical protein